MNHRNITNDIVCMSLNLYCKLFVPGEIVEIDLLQTPTEVTLKLLNLEDKPSHEVKSVYWKTLCANYLSWVKSNYPRDVYKRERKEIGDAWRKADELGGYLKFTLE